MALDRFVRWPPGHGRPTQAEIGEVLVDYLSGLATHVEWSRDRFIATLHGPVSFPFAQAGPSGVSRSLRASWRAQAQEADRRGGRWFEVWLDPDGSCLDVITRQTDDATNVLAKGFAELVARGWGGTLEDCSL